MKRILMIAMLCAPALQAQAPALFTEGSRILFQGDSITDGNRGRSADPNHILGHGYAFLISARYGAAVPERRLEFFNRGVSGNTVEDLAARWQADTLDLRPRILSILIGINDMARQVPAETFSLLYDSLLADTVKAMPNVRLVLCEPFALRAGRYDNEEWEERIAELRKRQAIVAGLAAKYGAVLVPLQRVFDEALRRAPATHWIWDGIHPTYSGHQLLADEWARAASEAPLAQARPVQSVRTGVLHPGYRASLPTLLLIGDSTVKNSWDTGPDGLWGWGRPLAAHFNEAGINVENQALGGTNSRSYISGGHWQRVLALVRPGDFVMMQFGHNDGGPNGSLRGSGEETEVRGAETIHTYGWYLAQYIADIKAKGAIPIVCSLVPRNDWADGKVLRAAADYGEWAREAAVESGAFFIDLNALIAARYDRMGEEAVKPLFPKEHTHTGWEGARLNAEMVVEGIKGLKECNLKSYLSALSPAGHPQK
jgi:lysophospholipase L1-like esterase